MFLIKQYNKLVKLFYIKKLVAALQHLIPLLLRCWIAVIFFKSGLTKISNWDQTLFLFEYEYQVPLLSSNIAALLGTAAEIICPILIILGVFTRLTILPLFIMTAIIELFIISHSDHLYWLVMMLSVISFGAGKISLDSQIAKSKKLTKI